MSIFQFQVNICWLLQGSWKTIFVLMFWIWLLVSVRCCHSEGLKSTIFMTLQISLALSRTTHDPGRPSISRIFDSNHASLAVKGILKVSQDLINEPQQQFWICLCISCLWQWPVPDQFQKAQRTLSLLASVLAASLVGHIKAHSLAWFHF